MRVFFFHGWGFTGTSGAGLSVECIAQTLGLKTRTVAITPGSIERGASTKKAEQYNHWTKSPQGFVGHFLDLLAGTSSPAGGGEAETDRVSGEEGTDQRRGLGEADGGTHLVKKKSWGALTATWVPHDVRDQVIDFVRRWSEKSEIGVGRFIDWLGVTASKFYDWRQRYGRVEHNGWLPRDFWLEPWEKESIIHYHLKNPLEGYRRLTFMRLDEDFVAVSPASVWRVLKQAGLLSRCKGKPSRKGTGFGQPLKAHEHWHIDVSYINLLGTFYYLCSVLDGCSRSLVHWDLRESMKEADIERILERAKEKYPQARPRIISDDGPQSLPATSRSSFAYRG